MKAMVRYVTENEKEYTALMFVCPGCQDFGGSGLHILAVNTTVKSPSWGWDGNLDHPTLAPSIKTQIGEKMICHSFLRGGIFDFLGDCTHKYANKKVEMPDLPSWVMKEDNNG